jgi:hypothetical protein
VVIPFCPLIIGLGFSLLAGTSMLARFYVYERPLASCANHSLFLKYIMFAGRCRQVADIPVPVEGGPPTRVLQDRSNAKRRDFNYFMRGGRHVNLLPSFARQGKGAGLRSVMRPQYWNGF